MRKIQAFLITIVLASEPRSKMYPYDGTIEEAVDILQRAYVVAAGAIGAATIIACSFASMGDQSWGEMLSELAMWGAI